MDKGIRLGKYRHYKGKDYEVIGIAKHSETLEDLVVYRKLYDDHGLWVRPLAMFMEDVEVEGKKVPRFEFQDDSCVHYMNDEIFEKEIALCRKLKKENGGKCKWGECDKCGVVPLLYKLGKGEFVEDKDAIDKLRRENLNL